VAHTWPGYAVIRGAFLHPDFNPAPSYMIGLFYPRDAAPPYRLPGSPAAVMSGGGAVSIHKWNPDYRDVETSSNEKALLRLRTYNFPAWTARIDGRPQEIHSDQQGVQIIEVPAGRHRVEALFLNTAPRTAGAAISGVSLVLICGLLAYRSRRAYTT
jgi:hypothetical protein